VDSHLRADWLVFNEAKTSTLPARGCCLTGERGKIAAALAEQRMSGV
jgi:hypothetical protein